MCSHIFIKVKPGTMATTMGYIAQIAKKVSPHIPFEFSFLDDTVNEIYQSEKKLSQLITTFTILAIVISCLGLFGMASFTAEQRTLEIGIRNIMGASIAGIAYLLSREYSKGVLIATLIACPLANYALDYWLQHYAYRIRLDIWIFFAASGITLLFSIVATSYQTIKAAMTNPVKALKYE